MPQIIFTDKSAIPDGLEVSEVEGKFVVNVVDKAKLDEFRENNVIIAKERDALKAFKDTVSPIVGDDLAEFSKTYDTLRGVNQQVADGKLKASGDVDAEVEKRTKAMREDYERQLLAKATEARSASDRAVTSETKFKRTLIDQAITKAAINPDNGVESSALIDLMTRAYNVFKVKDDGNVVPMDGEAVIYGNDGATPMTPDEWLGSLKKQAPHFFKRSAGGGAEGGSNKGFGGMTQEEIAKLSPEQKMAMARKVAK